MRHVVHSDAILLLMFGLLLIAQLRPIPCFSPRALQGRRVRGVLHPAHHLCLPLHQSDLPPHLHGAPWAHPVSACWWRGHAAETHACCHACRHEVAVLLPAQASLSGSSFQ